MVGPDNHWKGRAMLLTVTGPCCAGKGTIIREVRERKPEIRLSLSYTTRNLKPGEVNGREYVSISDQEFTQRALRRELAEYADVHGHFYGTPKAQIMPGLAGACDVIAEVDCRGARLIKQDYKQAYTLFVLPPSYDAVESRVRARGRDRDPHDVAARLELAKEEITKANLFDYWVLNEHLTTAVEEVIHLIEELQAGRKPELSRTSDKAKAVLSRVQSTFFQYV